MTLTQRTPQDRLGSHLRHTAARKSAKPKSALISSLLSKLASSSSWSQNVTRTVASKCWRRGVHHGTLLRNRLANVAVIGLDACTLRLRSDGLGRWGRPVRGARAFASPGAGAKRSNAPWKKLTVNLYGHTAGVHHANSRALQSARSCRGTHSQGQHNLQRYARHIAARFVARTT